ncbi:hypothetical protein HPP92_015593 [Vanilla planifolia]|uniref:Uncharacterized protein n=1 Tax=Vanilla planifolia TaxID=51239 RepID=A0A835QLG2_VANPL|nr:hypothetical protein HPP92_016249 [Vanilla planifolia]KAG0471047.1 hypothetical protein HPP92_015593 [Vanilla planifolia]
MSTKKLMVLFIISTIMFLACMEKTQAITCYCWCLRDQCLGNNKGKGPWFNKYSCGRACDRYCRENGYPGMPGSGDRYCGLP